MKLKCNSSQHILLANIFVCFRTILVCKHFLIDMEHFLLMIWRQKEQQSFFYVEPLSIARCQKQQQSFF